MDDGGEGSLYGMVGVLFKVVEGMGGIAVYGLL
jgi:hypothetical protein